MSLYTKSLLGLGGWVGCVGISLGGMGSFELVGGYVLGLVYHDDSIHTFGNVNDPHATSGWVIDMFWQ